MKCFPVSRPVEDGRLQSEDLMAETRDLRQLQSPSDPMQAHRVSGAGWGAIRMHPKLLFEFVSGLHLLVPESLPSCGPTERGGNLL